MTEEANSHERSSSAVHRNELQIGEISIVRMKAVINKSAVELFPTVLVEAITNGSAVEVVVGVPSSAEPLYNAIVRVPRRTRLEMSSLLMSTPVESSTNF